MSVSVISAVSQITKNNKTDRGGGGGGERNSNWRKRLYFYKDCSFSGFRQERDRDRVGGGGGERERLERKNFILQGLSFTDSGERDRDRDRQTDAFWPSQAIRLSGVLHFIAINITDWESKTALKIPIVMLAAFTEVIIQFLVNH